MSELPIVCTLTPNELEHRHEELLLGLLRRVESLGGQVSNLSPREGIRLQFPGSSEVLADIARMIEVERECCRFLRFDLTIAPDLGPISLEVTGPEGTAQFLAGLADDASRTDTTREQKRQSEPSRGTERRT